MDLKFALRSLRKNPGFAVLAVVVMALGIGANSAVFSVVHTVLLKPLDYRNPDRIVTLASLWRKSGDTGPVSAPDFHDWHDQSTAFAAMAYYADDSTSVMAGGPAEYAHGAAVTPEFFRVFAVEPVAGRLFSPEELKPNGPRAVLVSYSYWQSHLGANADALGQSVRMLGQSFRIAGVLPPRFHYPNGTDLWIPANVAFSETTSRGAHNYLVVGRLKPDVTMEQAQAQMTAIGARLEKQYPDDNTGKSVSVRRLRDTLVDNVKLTLYLLLGAVALVLLIACANVANLLLAKSTARMHEIAIRAAVGASRGRVVRQLITESMVLAAIAGAGGLLLAKWGLDALVALAPTHVPRLEESGIDGWVLAFTLGVSLAASLLFGLAPALQISRVDLNEALKQGASRAIGGRAGRTRAVLVVTEVALSVVLLTGAGLLIRSFIALRHVALGFEPEHVLVMQSSVPASDDESARRATRFYKDLLSDLATLPGVAAVGATRNPPGQAYSEGSYSIDRLVKFTAHTPQAVFSVMTPGALAALGIPLKRGRDFTGGDTYSAPFAALINETLARTSFPGQDPIGRTIYYGFDSPKPMKIVGVVGDVRQYGPATAAWPEIIVPAEQHPGPSTALNIVVRASVPAQTLWGPIQRKVHAHSAEVPVKFTSMQELLAENTAAPRFQTLLLAIFAGIAVCLAMAGVYGVVAYTVGQRAGEIGLRMALGARSSDVLRLVLRQGVTLTAIGLAAGLTAAFAATRLLASMLFEVKATDARTYLGVATLLMLVSLVASYIPARRAVRVDPVSSLRQE
ncbi:MAG: ABC transporter permease [Bryobacteraceae bacterium]